MGKLDDMKRAIANKPATIPKMDQAAPPPKPKPEEKPKKEKPPQKVSKDGIIAEGRFRWFCGHTQDIAEQCKKQCYNCFRNTSPILKPCKDPVGTKKEVTWDGENHVGIMTVPGCPIVFKTAKRIEKWALHDLHHQYRKWLLKNQKEEDKKEN